MNTFLIYLVIGLTTGAVYAVAASGLVVTYATSRVFNFAHGAVGMMAAFLAYTLWVDDGWPAWAAIGLCVLVVAPLVGVFLDFAVMRHLENATVAVRLAVTLIIFLFLQGLAAYIWGSDLRSMPAIFGDGSITVGTLSVSADQLATMAIAILLAAGLFLLFRRTRIGTVMRGVVDDRELMELHGINPRLATAFSWGLGSALAALAGILIAPGLSMSIDALSLLVVSAYAAAIFGGLTSLPMTFLGAIGLGVVTAMLVGYVPIGSEVLQALAPVAPFLLLFVALVLRREESGVFQRIQTFTEPRAPRLVTSVIAGVVAVVIAIVVAPELSNLHALVIGTALVYAAIMLSLVLVAGMAGMVSLAQLTFVGIGGVAISHLATGWPYWLALLVATLAAAAVGALVALPALRLRGLYLALSTLAFALLMDKAFFVNSSVFPSTGGAIPVRSPSLFGLSANSFNAMIPLLAAVVAVYAIIVLQIRKGRMGRRLAAMRDAPAAAGALGLSVVRTKLVVFTIAAGMAGLVGGLYGGLGHQVIASQFNYQQSLVALLILVIWGLSSVPGAIIGATFYAVFFLLLPDWVRDPELVKLIQPMAIGLAMFGLATHPEGLINQYRGPISRLLGRGRRKVDPPAPLVVPAQPERVR